MEPETRTDINLSSPTRAYITLTESRHPNLWYHEFIDELFILTSEGFKLASGKKRDSANCLILTPAPIAISEQIMQENAPKHGV